MDMASRPSLDRSSSVWQINQLCDRFEADWLAGKKPLIEHFLESADAGKREELLSELLGLELEYLFREHSAPALEHYLRRFPGDAAVVMRIYQESSARAAAWLDSSRSHHAPPGDGGLKADATGVAPAQIGRYKVLRQIGSGGFGLVYRAYDEELQREVALKIPSSRRLSSARDVDAFLKEARILAGLDHPGIVPVYDVGRMESGLCYIVSKLIEGEDLAARLRRRRLPLGDTVALVRQVSLAIHHAHERGLVHRDIKPANILLDLLDRPFVVDFGLALREVDFGHGPICAGTPYYMSPEQARGEGHRVDARSDVYSLGVVLYELLTGSRPFVTASSLELINQIISIDPLPPREIDPSIARELERVSLKALSKRASDRYSSAQELADDLLEWEHDRTNRRLSAPPAPSTIDYAHIPDASSSPTRNSSQRTLAVVPRGLRSFEAQDADYFLELLPGPRDRNGLPESIGFWKVRIEEIDPDKTFAVGLIYGPSGCGKSSLVKAGLLPRLTENVLVVYVEATPHETEARILSGLRRALPGVVPEAGLAEVLAALRRGEISHGRRKVLLVLDQFEQWLHGSHDEQASSLAKALRHCDGQQIQAVLMIRDDFWLAACRFMRELEIRLVEGQNLALVDLFDLRHARKVLAILGRAYGQLPESLGGCLPEQEQFLDQAIQVLSQDDKVVPVALSVFAEMVKSRTWNPATLRSMGGMEGIGETFLEETFSARTASPEHRLHGTAARAVLAKLLPEIGSELKGTMRGYQELLEASGYASRPGEFAELLRILDGELRLVVPTDPSGMAGNEWQTDTIQGSGYAGNPDSENMEDTALGSRSGRSSPLATQYYQLTHDYLVPSLRRWLSRKQRETRRGRAALRLGEWTEQWRNKPSSRNLPSAWETLQIRLLTRPVAWTPMQKSMMRAAGKLHLRRTLVSFLLLAAFFVCGSHIWRTVNETRLEGQATALVSRLLDADTSEVLRIIEELDEWHERVDPRLKAVVADPDAPAKARWHAALALLPVDRTPLDTIQRFLLTANPQELLVIRTALSPYSEELTQPFWQIALDQDGDRDQQFRIAAALAALDPASDSWERINRGIVARLVTLNTLEVPLWMEAFKPASRWLLAPLRQIFLEQQETEPGLVAARVLAEYAVDDVELLIKLLRNAHPRQLDALIAKLQSHPQHAIPKLQEILGERVSPLWFARPKDAHPIDPGAYQDELAKLRAKAALALLGIGHGDVVWPMLVHSPDPRLRTLLINQFATAGIKPQRLLQRLEVEPEVSVRRALLLGLGGYALESFSVEERERLKTRFLTLYETDPDPGIHSAIDWLLRRWGAGVQLLERDQKLAATTGSADRRWFVSSLGHQFAVIDGPVQFLMGSPWNEWFRQADEHLHRRWIGRAFAISTKEVTLAQFRRFLKEHQPSGSQFATDPQCPANFISWYLAARYCRWLGEQENIPEDQQCYPPVADIGPNMKLPANFLERTGYRLPTEAEWEFACRSGSTTSRHYGNDPWSLESYGCHSLAGKYCMLPTGSLKPNDFGLFDVHGNSAEWCHDAYAHYGIGKLGDILQDDTHQAVVPGLVPRVVRGEAFCNSATGMRSATRRPVPPDAEYPDMGFRIARTLRTPALSVRLERQPSATVAHFRVLGTGVPFVVQDVDAQLDVTPRQGITPADLKVVSSTSMAGPFSFSVRRTDSSTSVRATGVFVRPRWHVQFHAWKPSPTWANGLHPDWCELASGPSIEERTVNELDFDWGNTQPSPKVPADYFCLSATASLDLPAGTYEIWNKADDALRIYVDDRLVLDRWSPGYSEDLTELSLATGTHMVRVEYAEIEGGATLAIRIRAVR